MTILDEIAAKTRLRVQAQKAVTPQAALEKDAAVGGFRLSKAIKAEAGVSLICEIKKASPSKGIISEDFPYLDIARDYRAGGAAAISVLTEPHWFLGSDAVLAAVRRETDLPVLRKDFTVDDYQIYEAAALRADAVLLIAAILTDGELARFGALSESLGLDALFEAHDETELARCLGAGAKIVGVNNRDLRDFSVDTARAERLRSRVPAGVLFVAESGVKARADMIALERIGADAALVGETVMRAARRADTVRQLRRGEIDED